MKENYETFLDTDYEVIREGDLEEIVKFTEKTKKHSRVIDKIGCIALPILVTAASYLTAKLVVPDLEKIFFPNASAGKIYEVENYLEEKRTKGEIIEFSNVSEIMMKDYREFLGDVLLAEHMKNVKKYNKRGNFREDPQETVLARTLLGEGFKGENKDYVYGVLCSIYNRAKLTKKSVKDVVLQNGKIEDGTIVYQYSCFNGWDNSLPRVKDPVRHYGWESWKGAYRTNLMFGNGLLPPENKIQKMLEKTTHYYVDSGKLKKNPPRWADNERLLGTVKVASGHTAYFYDLYSLKKPELIVKNKIQK